MRIQDAYTKISPSEAREARDAQKAAKDAAAKAGQGPAKPGDASGVKVTLSAEAVQRAQSAEVDHAKVARLRDAVQNGTLQVDARAIANRLVEGD